MKYFDNWEFNKIIPLIETNPFEAKIRFEEYLKKYPKDYTTYPFYISTLITLRELNEAEKVLEYITTIIDQDIKYVNNYKNNTRSKLLNEHILTVKVKLLLYQDKYDIKVDTIEENKITKNHGE